MDAVGVVLAAGLGTRVGADGNKAYLPLAGRSMLAWSLDTLIGLPGIARVILVYRQGESSLARDTLVNEIDSSAIEFVEGGETRHASETNVVRYLADDIESGAVDVVAVHDAARPLAGPDMFVEAITLARRFGGALPALPIRDLARAGDTGLEPLPQGRELVRVQTPQAFRARDLLHAYRCAERDGFEGTDTSSCIERYTGIEVRTFPGRAENLKVTYPRDVAVAHHLLISAEGAAGPR
ncbi:IspD/TarI family cytidylyltransferase [Mycolicibacterium vaccae]|uniref:2-C-methyl-D-erythritol 4-phosphate cytidylyltransferase n=1 Tax=Mycolicibacterium vaccae ATCC 25954 TaxID=1194972 RepID=K0VCY6_MYCVA|nr:IspD/TarI family cytidylyltransferase [Mycolicibacterium vaccae]ANI41030.1 2-C-methyl-D-erythritol 4-phosphate cytidylyltransferase [Mycolicibacterium vaccae 95051]EJZ12753.1 2-C-methyl-D-erythritol 4-phosphate cytidylyltransferase [Mycolicibacterium vaccae ATCC 25954]MCV7061316.1 2-C-methyl-D-erythritol 4-phosphate cytidylyltransferase [Mycolicibacterium vaccae]